jgi:hypothetical protein
VDFVTIPFLMQTISEVLASKLPPGSPTQPITQVDERIPPSDMYGSSHSQRVTCRSGCFFLPCVRELKAQTNRKMSFTKEEPHHGHGHIHHG